MNRNPLLWLLLGFAATVQAGNVNVSTPGGGTVTKTVLSNNWQTVTATPAPGWTFLYWLGDAGGTNPVVTLNATRDLTVQGVFGTPVSISSVMTIDPDLPFYAYGSAVRLTAIATSGLYFANWSGSNSGTNNPLTIVVTNANINIAAHLNALAGSQGALTIIESGQGHVIVSPQENPYTVGETANLTAIPAPGQDFLGWSGDAVGNQSPLPVLMTQSKTVTATFTRRPRLRVGTSLEGLIESGFRLTVTNVVGGNYQMLGSTDLQNWSPLGYLTNTYGVAQFTDSAAINLPAREYRSLVLNPPASYSVTLKNLGDVAGATVPVGTVPLIQPSNLGQTAAPFTVPAAGLISLTAQNYTDIPSNTVASGTALVPLNNIGTIAAIIGPVVHGTPTTIPVTAPLPAPISFTPNQHIYIGGYGLTLTTNAPAETNLAAVADYWPDAFSVYFNPGQSLLISQNPPANLGHTSGAFQAPAINRTVQITVPDYTGTTNSAVLMQGASYLITSVGRQTAAVTLTLPFTGAPGTDILIGGDSYHIVSTNSALSLNVYPNTGSPAAGTVVPAGTAVTSTNNVASTPLGALLARFVVPTLGSTVSAKLSAPYTGPLNQTVWINNKPYQITAAGGG